MYIYLSEITHMIGPRILKHMHIQAFQKYIFSNVKFWYIKMHRGIATFSDLKILRFKYPVEQQAETSEESALQNFMLVTPQPQ